MVRIFGSLALFALCLLAVNALFGRRLDEYQVTFEKVGSELESLYEQKRELENRPQTPRGVLPRLQREIDAQYDRLEPVRHAARIQFLFLVATALVTLLVNSITITYFIGTSRWCKEVVDEYQLDSSLAARSTMLKRRTFPWSMLAIVAVLLVASLGAAANPGVMLGAAAGWILPYQITSALVLALIAFAFFKQLSGMTANHAVINEILERVAAMRAQDTAGDG